MHLSCGLKLQRAVSKHKKGKAQRTMAMSRQRAPEATSTFKFSEKPVSKSGSTGESSHGFNQNNDARTDQRKGSPCPAGTPIGSAEIHVPSLHPPPTNADSRMLPEIRDITCVIGGQQC